MPTAQIIRRKSKDVPTKINGESLEILEYFTSADFKATDLVVAKLNGKHPKARNKVCSLFYFVIHGKLNIVIEDQRYYLKEKDSVFIPATKIYELSGTAEFVVVSVPAFDVNQYELVV